MSPRPSSPLRGVLALVAVLALLLAACGSSKNAPDADGANKQGGGEATEPADGTTKVNDDGSIDVVDASGDVVTLDQAATKVVALEWVYVEDLLAVGVTPVGVADIEGYGTYVRSEPAIPDGVTDVGTRQEPSIERIRELQPDLIITAADRDTDALASLADIATVLTFQAYPKDDSSQLEEMRTTFASVAAAVGKADEATEILDDLDTKLAEGAATIAETELPTDRVALAQGVGSLDAPMFRLFTDNAMVVELTAELGLENGWEGEEDPSGFSTVSIEGLTQITDAWFLPVADQETQEIFEERYADSPLWKALSFVTDDRIRVLGGDTWFFGGPLSADLFVDRVVTALTS